MSVWESVRSPLGGSLGDTHPLGTCISNNKENLVLTQFSSVLYCMHVIPHESLIDFIDWPAHSPKQALSAVKAAHCNSSKVNVLVT